MASTAHSVPRIAAILAVAAMLVLAGCSSGADSTPGATTDAPDDTTTAMDDSGMDDGDTGDSNGDDGDTGDSNGDDGDTGDSDSDTGDARNITADHTEALLNADSFTASFTLTQTSVNQNGEETNTTVTLTTMIDQVDERGYANQTVSSGGGLGSIVSEAYTDGDESFQRQDSPFSGTQYYYGSEPYGPESNVSAVNASAVGFTGQQLLFGASDLAWTNEGADTRDGVSVTHYSIDDGAAIEDAGGQIIPNASSIDSVSVDAYVDDDGIVREMTWSFSGTDQNGNAISFESTYRTTDVGSTTVEAPGWLEEARQQTDG